MSVNLTNIPKRLALKIFRAFGYDVVATKPKNSPADRGSVTDFPSDMDDDACRTIELVKPFTMTSVERIFTLCKSVEYVVHHDIPGAIVECGVWKGGSMLAVMDTLNRLTQVRDLYLFDTFEGMSDPTEFDRDYRDVDAVDQLISTKRETSLVWAYSPLDEVKDNLSRVNYQSERINFIAGKVENTIPANAPEQIALLRLDTDWYESTRHELEHLYPRLSVGGVLIIDDYGHWKGARKAVDDYIKDKGLKLFLNRIDYTGRSCIKIE